MSAAELETGARAVRVVLDKHQTMTLAGAEALDLSAEEAGRLIRELGQGFVAAISILRDIQKDLANARFDTCELCDQLKRALGGLPDDDLDGLLADLE